MAFELQKFWLFLGPLVVAAIFTGGLRIYLLRRDILDHPNHRSSHQSPVPHGGGIAVLVTIAVSWIWWSTTTTMLADSTVAITLIALALGLLSRIDDLRNLPVVPRLGAHMAAVALGLSLFHGPIIHDALPLWLDRVLCFFGWVWFLNLFNFMDGIDGITSIETLSLSLGSIVLILIAPMTVATSAALIDLNLIVAGAILGFLLWNWFPAKIFLGDVGSIPLGFILGWLLLSLTQAGLGAEAVLLALYYLIDASLTLSKRIFRREKFWQPHRQHAFQKAVQSGLSHARVAFVVAIGNGILMIAAILMLKGSVVTSTTIAVICMIALHGYLRHQGASGNSWA